MTATDAFSREAALVAADRKRRSWGQLALHTAVAVALLWLPSERAGSTKQLAVAAAWAIAVAAAVVLRFGPSRAYRIVDVCEQIATPAALALVIYAADNASAPVWLLCFVRSFAWWPRRRYRAHAERVGLIGANVGLAIAFATHGEVSSSAAVLAVLLVLLVDLEVTGALVEQSLEIEAERHALHRELENKSARSDRDRIARELHDGLGADLVAMLMSLRSQGPHLAEAVGQIEATLAELRGVVWALRDNRGTLGELDKLLGVRIRGAAPALVMRSQCAAHQGLALIEAAAAVPALSALPALIRQVATLTGARELHVCLNAEPELSVQLTFTPVAASHLPALAALQASQSRARLVENGVELAVRFASSGSLTPASSNRPGAGAPDCA